MSADIFLDTNVLVYSFDQSAPRKRQRALGIVRDRTDGDWAVSWQVIQEFTAVALHRFAQPMNTADLKILHRTLLWPACQVLPSVGLSQHALALHEETQYRFYDCLILAAAIVSGASRLYSEDLQADRVVQNVRIVNPFVR